MTNPTNRKLDASKVRALWRLRGKASQRERARLFSVSAGLVARIDAGWAWRGVTGLPIPLTERGRKVAR